MSVFKRLLKKVDAAVRSTAGMEAKTEAVGKVLKRHLTRELELPERLRAESFEHYARHLVYLAPKGLYEILVMVWMPGQGTAIHDHDGTWCLEGCLEGRLRVTSYRLPEYVAQGLARLKPERRIAMKRGSVDRVVPPFEYHKIENPYDETAITVHIYGKQLKSCHRFIPKEGDIFAIERVELDYSSLPC
ncbi:MAG: hypothetical protein HY602_00905 [Parcubacteria group bacterium]|nr:hypothetical protein [Parcubacteria group bacterium]